jgi:hypothetical protein
MFIFYSCSNLVWITIMLHSRHNNCWRLVLLRIYCTFKSRCCLWQIFVECQHKTCWKKHNNIFPIVNLKYVVQIHTLDYRVVHYIHLTTESSITYTWPSSRPLLTWPSSRPLLPQFFSRLFIFIQCLADCFEHVYKDDVFINMLNVYSFLLISRCSTNKYQLTI